MCSGRMRDLCQTHGSKCLDAGFYALSLQTFITERFQRFDLQVLSGMTCHIVVQATSETHAANSESCDLELSRI